MYPGEEPQHHPHHHLPTMDDGDDHPDNRYQEYDPRTPYPPLGEDHHQPPPPKPLFSPRSRQPSKKHSTPQMSIPTPQRPLQPPQPMFFPTSPSPKPPPPPYHHHGDIRYDDYNRRRQLFAVIATLLLLLGLTALIIWLLYRPSKPHFTAVSAAVYFLNTTSQPPYVAASLQITVLTRNPSKRTSLYYDNLAVAVHYRNHPITPPASLPQLHLLKRSTVMMSPAIGGGPAVAVPPEVEEGLATDKAYGVVGLSWVLVGRVKYTAGWFRSGHKRIYVRCDVIVGLKSGGGGGGRYGYPSGQAPLLANRPCFVDM